MKPSKLHPSSPSPKTPDPVASVSVRSATGEPIDPQHLEQMEELDDVIFAALQGDPSALEQSAVLYRRTARQTPSELLEESREQYLHRAESIVRSYPVDPAESLGQTFAALEILTMLAE